MRAGSMPVALLWALAACGGGRSDAVITSAYQDLPADRVLYEATFATTVDGIRRAVQRSDSMYLYEDSTVAEMFGVQLMMYDTLGRRTAELGSRGGRFDMRTQKMVAQGEVVLRLSDGRRIESEELNYDPEQHRIWSDVFTRMHWADGGSTTFDTFTVDDEFRNPMGTNARGRIPGLKL